jgi:hypothetical protein
MVWNTLSEGRSRSYGAYPDREPSAGGANATKGEAQFDRPRRRLMGRGDATLLDQFGPISARARCAPGALEALETRRQ